MSGQLKLLLAAIVVVALGACKGKKQDLPDGGYPENINDVVMADCAISGCHNDASNFAAGELNLSTYAKVFVGSSGGTPIVPYRSDQSFITYFINTDPATGLTQNPVMPFGREALTAEQVQEIRDWIDIGAPDKDGNVMWSNANDRQLYLSNQGCDMVSSIDINTGVVRRYIDVGINSSAIEAPHMLKFSPDGNYWYAVFTEGAVNPNLEVYSSADNSLVKRIDIGAGDWNTVTITPDGKYAFCAAIQKQASQGSGAGTVAVVDLDAGSLLLYLSGAPTAHGTAISPDGKRLYVTQQLDDDITWFDITDPTAPSDIDEVDLDQWSPRTELHKSHEIMFTPDGSKYLVTCQGTDEVRIFATDNDSLLAVIPVGNYPSEISMSSTFPYAFITCTDDTTTFSGDPSRRGSVYIINTSTMQQQAVLYTGYQPHGIAVDDVTGRCYVAHRNIDTDGPAPHHISECGGRNGYITFIDMNTLTVDPDYKMEVSVDPYSLVLKP